MKDDVPLIDQLVFVPTKFEDDMSDVYYPSQEEIKRATQKIREEWDEKKEMLRRAEPQEEVVEILEVSVIRGRARYVE